MVETPHGIIATARNRWRFREGLLLRESQKNPSFVSRHNVRLLIRRRAARRGATRVYVRGSHVETIFWLTSYDTRPKITRHIRTYENPYRDVRNSNIVTVE